MDILKWYKDGIKFLQTYDIDSAVFGAFLLGIMIGAFDGALQNVNPIIYFALGVGFLSPVMYKFILRDKETFEPKVIIKTVVKEVAAKKKPAAKKAAVKKPTATKKAAVKKAPAKKKPAVKKAPAKKTTKK